MLMLLSLLPPIVGALIVFRMEDNEKRHRFTAAAVICTALLAVGAAFLGMLREFPTEITLLHLDDTLTLSFGADGLSLFFIALVSFIWCFVQFHAFGYMKHEGNEGQFFGFFLLTYASLIALAFAKNAVTFYMCFEFMSLSSMPLVLHNGTEKSRMAAFKYLGYSTLGALMALMGFFLLGAQGNDLTFTPGGAGLVGDPKILLAAAFLIVLGFGAKAGMVPLQMWLTEAHPVAPSPASAVLSGLITKAGVLAIIDAGPARKDPQKAHGVFHRLKCVLCDLRPLCDGRSRPRRRGRVFADRLPRAGQGRAVSLRGLHHLRDC